MFIQIRGNGSETYTIMSINSERDMFLTEIVCEFAVITHAMDCHTVTRELGIEPTRYFNKGDKVTSQFSPTIGFRHHGLWAITLRPVTSDTPDLSSYLTYFQDLLAEKIDVIKKLKSQYKFECVFSIDIDTEDGGFGFDLSEIELSFITDIASRFSCSMMAVDKIHR